MTGVDRMKEGRRREIQTFKGNYNEVRTSIRFIGRDSVFFISSTCLHVPDVRLHRSFSLQSLWVTEHCLTWPGPYIACLASTGYQVGILVL